VTQWDFISSNLCVLHYVKRRSQAKSMLGSKCCIFYSAYRLYMQQTCTGTHHRVCTEMTTDNNLVHRSIILGIGAF